MELKVQKALNQLGAAYIVAHFENEDDDRSSSFWSHTSSTKNGNQKFSFYIKLTSEILAKMKFIRRKINHLSIFVCLLRAGKVNEENEIEL